MNPKKERAATNGPNQFPLKEHDKLTMLFTTEGASERSSENWLHPAFSWILDELKPIRQEYRQATCDQVRRDALRSMENKAQRLYDCPGLGWEASRNDRRLDAWTVAKCLVNNDVEGLRSLSGWLYEAERKQARIEFERLLRKSEIPVNGNLKKEFLADTPERQRLCNAAKAWVQALVPGTAKLDYLAERIRYQSANTLGLVLSGPVGCGKTFTAQYLARLLMERGVETLWTSQANLVNKFRQIAARESDDSEPAFMERCLSAPVMFIDDLGASALGTWEEGKVEAIIEGRLSNEMTLVITTNLNDEHLKSAVGQRIASRLKLLLPLASFPDEDLRDRFGDRRNAS